MRGRNLKLDKGPTPSFSSKSNRQIAESALEWSSLKDDGLRLRCGELSAQEIKNIRAVLNSVVGYEIASNL